MKCVAWTTVKNLNLPSLPYDENKEVKGSFSCHFMHGRKAILLNSWCLLAPSTWSNSDEMLSITIAYAELQTLHRNHDEKMTHFLYFPVDSALLLACFTPCKTYWSMISVIQQHPLFQFLHDFYWWAQFNWQNSAQWETPKLSYLLDAEVIYKGEKWGGFTGKLSLQILLKFRKLNRFPGIHWWNGTNLRKKLIAFWEKSLSLT